MKPETDLETLRDVILNAFPDLESSKFTLLTQGWDSLAADVDDRWIFKFPRQDKAEIALIREVNLLTIIRPAISMPVPDITLYPGPPLFSRHQKIKGEHLLAADYEHIPESARQQLAEKLARFYAELHQLDTNTMKAAGAGSVWVWKQPEEITEKALPILPPDLRAFAEKTLADWQTLPPDPYGITYGFFDGHGWNMAFDHQKHRLNGMYDFADSGFGALHQEFIYSNFISPDLTARIITAYEAMTGKNLDRQRISILTGAHRLSELAEMADDTEHSPFMLGNWAKWVSYSISD